MLNASGASEAAVTIRTRIGLIKFRECSKLLYGKKFSLEMKGRIYQSCVRSAMLYGRENEMANLRTEKATIRAMYGVTLIEKRRSQELMSFVGFERCFEWTSQGEWNTMIGACFEKG